MNPIDAELLKIKHVKSSQGLADPRGRCGNWQENDLLDLVVVPEIYSSDGAALASSGNLVKVRRKRCSNDSASIRVRQVGVYVPYRRRLPTRQLRILPAKKKPSSPLLRDCFL